MAKGYRIGCICLLVVSSSAAARPAREPFAPAAPHLRGTSSLGAVRPTSAAAVNETLFFGGTTWAPDSGRWEAIPDSVWTFETGVGSAIKEPGHTYPGVDPDKPDGFHAYMEGWVGIDFTRPNPTPALFRRLAAEDPRWGADGPCVGAVGGLEGNYSLWAGLLPDEADSLCYMTGRGYGNQWKVCVGRSFEVPGGQALTLEYDYRNESEPNYDYCRVTVESAAESTEVAAYTGVVSGHESLVLNPGVELPATADSVRIIFCVESDVAWSDEDGRYATTCGAFALDNIVLSGAIEDTADFEVDDGGWRVIPLEPSSGPGGEWSRLMAVEDLPPMAGAVEGTCSPGDSVLVLYDPGTLGHPVYQDNAVVSPWIDLKRAGAVGYPGYVFHIGGYHNLPLLNYVFVTAYFQWYPYRCPQTNHVGVSPWTSTGYVYPFAGSPICTDGPEGYVSTRTEWPVDAEEVRIAVGEVSYCRFYNNCTGVTNTTPWIDNVRFGVRTVNTLQSLIDAAAAGDTVWVPPGVYTGTGYRDLDFHGKGIVLAGTAGPEATVIDCERQDRGFIFQSGEDSTAVVQGFTIRNGRPPNFDFIRDQDGGGIYVAAESHPVFRDCVIESCEARYGGGVGTDQSNASAQLIRCRLTGNVANEGGGVAWEAELTDCVLDGNSARGGGGLLLFRGTVIRCELSHNQATQEGGGGGYSYGDWVDCFIHDNSAAGNGGGVGSYRGSIIRCRIENNTAGGWGGGAESGGYVHGCTILGNTAAGHGGGINFSGGLLDSCLISGNSAQGGGGVRLNPLPLPSGVLSPEAVWPPRVGGCVITGNRAEKGGGIMADSDLGYSVEWTNCTVSGNRASLGGGIYLQGYTEVYLTRCILRGNGADHAGAGAYLELHDIIRPHCCAALAEEFAGRQSSVYFTGSQITEDPLFCESWGWESAPTTSGEYTLAAASPCLPANNDCADLVGALGEGCGATTGVGDDLEGPKPPVLAAYPNPFYGSLHLSVTGPKGTDASGIEIFDVRGRLIWSRDLPAAAGELDWNGFDTSGNPVAPGVYFVHFRSGEVTKAARVVRLR